MGRPEIRRNLTASPSSDLEQFKFRHLHPHVRMGTASDRYAGWVGQNYSAESYLGRINQRTKVLKDQSFIEQVLPVESMAEYFEHFSILEIDFTSYRTLLNKNGKPTQNLKVLQTYKGHLQSGDYLLLKVPQAITAPKLRRGGQYQDNPTFLNAKAFTNQFHKPATELLGQNVQGFIFEQKYLRKQDRPPVNEMADALDTFFQEIPLDSLYHLELRTDLYLREPVFEVLERHGVGQVFQCRQTMRH